MNDTNDNFNNAFNKLINSINGQSSFSIQNEAQQNDYRLENVVMYKLTKGFTDVIKISPVIATDDVDEYKKILLTKEEFCKKFEDMFREFKLAIKRKSITLEELELKVFSEYGLVSETYLKMANPIKDDVIEFMSEEKYIKMRKMRKNIK